MSKLASCLLVVTAEVDPEVEAEWNRWYDEVHVPDVLACPGVLSGRRYLASGEIAENHHGLSKRFSARIYTTVYELESPAVVTTKEFAAMRGWAHFTPRVRSQTRVVSALKG